VVSGLYGLEAAGLFEELHGVGHVQTPLPIGAAASERFLAAVGRALKIPSRKVAKAVEAAGARHYAHLEPIIDVYNDMEAQRHALVVGDANYAPALAVFLAEDLGWVPELVVIVNDLAEDARAGLLAFLESSGGLAGERVVFEHRADRIAAEARLIWPEEAPRYRDPKRPILVAGSSLERGLAADLGAAHLSLTWPVSNRAILTRGHTGFDGGLVLTEDVVSACVAGR
jgi:nitrogenase molybdenum-iron protein beta chain